MSNHTRPRRRRWTVEECQKLSARNCPASFDTITIERPPFFAARTLLICGQCQTPRRFLYKRPDSENWACRVCHRLSYAANNVTANQRKRVTQEVERLHDAEVQRELVRLGLVKAAMSTNELTRTIALYHAERAIALREARNLYRQSRRKRRAPG